MHVHPERALAPHGAGSRARSTLRRSQATSLIPLLGALLACGGGSRFQAEFVTGPNGKPAVLLRCTGAATCYAQASELCPAGYTIADSSRYSETKQSLTDILFDTCKQKTEPGCERQVKELLIQCNDRPPAED